MEFEFHKYIFFSFLFFFLMQIQLSELLSALLSELLIFIRCFNYSLLMEILLKLNSNILTKEKVMCH